MPGPESADTIRRLQTEAARRERNRRLAIAGAAIAVVVILVAALVVAKLASGGGSHHNTATPQTGLSAVVSETTNVPATTLDSVGAGSASNIPKIYSGSTALTSQGKPEVLYMGGEFCPYCAATRWGIVVALSRFGSFQNLRLMSSSSDDVYPDTPTLTFHRATYSSPTVVFDGYELSDRNQQPLETPPASAQAIFEKYDSPPYVPSSQRGSIPFLDIAGRYYLSGTAYDPQILHGLTHEQVAGDLKNSASPVAQAIDGEANLITAAICSTTNGQPGTVCSAAGVRAAAAKLGSGG